MFKKNKRIVFSFLLIFLLSLIFSPVLAQMTPTENSQPASSEILPNLKHSEMLINYAASGIGYDTNSSVEIVIGSIIQTALSLIGIFFLILIIIGGYQWMTAGGNEESITKAKNRIKNATIGLVIVLAAYAISYFVVDILIGQTL
jgi:hypothetical protein